MERSLQVRRLGMQPIALFYQRIHVEVSDDHDVRLLKNFYNPKPLPSDVGPLLRSRTPTTTLTNFRKTRKRHATTVYQRSGCPLQRRHVSRQDRKRRPGRKARMSHLRTTKSSKKRPKNPSLHASNYHGSEHVVTVNAVTWFRRR